jgi:hypothetical protein
VNFTLADQPMPAVAVPLDPPEQGHHWAPCTASPSYTDRYALVTLQDSRGRSIEQWYVQVPEVTS